MLFLSLLMSSSLVFGQGASLGWAGSMGGNLDDAANDVATDVSGNVYTVGSFKNTVDFNPGAGVYNLTSNGSNDIYIQKLDASGNFIWAKNIGAAGNDAALAIDIDLNGNLLITGHFAHTVDFDPGVGVSNLTYNGTVDIFILKLDANGAFIWAKAIGANLHEVANTISTDQSGSVYLSGFYLNTVDFDPGVGTSNLTSNGGEDIFILKLDVNGNYVWAKSIGGTGNDEGNSIVADQSGNILVTGYFSNTADFDVGAGIFNMTSAGGRDIFVLKLDLNGNYNWARRMGSTGNDSGNAITVDVFGDVYTTGYFSGTVDFDPNAGTYNLTSNNGSADIFIQKLTIKSTFKAVQSMGGTGDDQGISISTNAVGDVYTTGSFENTVDFNPYQGVHYLTSNGLNDIFVQKMNKNGHYLWSFAIGGTYYDNVNAITTNSNCDFYIAGKFYNPLDADPGAGTTTLTSNGSTDAFIIRYNEGQIAYNTLFTYDVLCDAYGDAHVTVTGYEQAFGNPDYGFYLYEYTPGNVGSAVLKETIASWQQATPYAYNPGPFTFTYDLDATKLYYVKHGIWDACTGWQETIIYDIDYTEAAPQPEGYFTNTTSGSAMTTFLPCDPIYFIETYESAHGMNYNNYNLALWSRPCGSTGSFTWVNSTKHGWAAANSTFPSAFDLKNHYNDVTFAVGYEYQVQVAMRNECDGWEAVLLTFCINGACRPAAPTGTVSNEALNADFDIKLYPNPVQSVLNFSSEGVEINSLRVMNALGQTLSLVKEASSQLDVSDLPSGMYVLEFETNQGLLRKQFIKQ